MKRIAFFVFASLIATTILAQIPTANLLGYYPFCGNANDASGNGNNGTVMGASLTLDRFGNPNSAYSFNGLGEYISLPPADFVGLNIYSCSLWIRPTASVNPGYIAYNAGSQNALECQGINYNPPGIFAGSYNNGSNPVQSYVNSSPISGINAWVHVVVSRDMNTLRVYVNGTQVQQVPTANTNNQTADYGNGPYAAIIGARSTLQTFFKGQIDDVRIYSSVLNQNDVNALYLEAPFSVSVNSGTICAGNSFTLLPTGGISYAYPGGSPVVSPLSSQVYTVQCMVVNGCTVAATASVAVVANSFVINVNSGTVCPGNSFMLLPSGAVSYTYSSGSPLVSPSGNSVYTILGTDINGCTSSATASVTVSAFTINVSGGVICRGGSFTLTPTGAVSYTYSGGSAVVSPAITTVYLISGLNAAGCMATAMANVVVNLCTGMEQLTAQQQDFYIYPNPNNGDFTISFNTMEGNTEIILTDVQGRVIKSFKNESSNNPYPIRSELSAGCYMASLVRNGKIIAQKKIVVLNQ